MLPTENPWPYAIVLACVAIILVVKWASKRKPRFLILAVASLLLAVGSVVLDQLVKTPGEVVVEHIYGLTSAFQKQDEQKTLSYFSARAKEREIVRTVMHAVHVSDNLRITDVLVTFKANDSLAISHFRANANVSVNLPGIGGLESSPQTSRWELEWEREAGEWKIVKVHRLHPLNGSEIGFMAGN